jgi:dynein heavy chain 2, cytosolic
VGDAFSPFR